MDIYGHPTPSRGRINDRVPSEIHRCMLWIMLGSDRTFNNADVFVYYSHVDSRLGRLCAKEQERHSTYIVECNTNIANTSQGASRLDGLMNTLFPHDHCQRFDTTELAIRSEQVITCRLCSCDSGHNGD
jgi:hypothetical protein